VMHHTSISPSYPHLNPSHANWKP